jgi:hypothetical protein
LAQNNIYAQRYFDSLRKSEGEAEAEDKDTEIKSLEDIYAIDKKPYNNTTMEKVYYFLQKRVVGENAPKDLFFKFKTEGLQQIESFTYEVFPTNDANEKRIARIKPVLVGKGGEAEGPFIRVDPTGNTATFQVKKEMVVTKKSEPKTYLDTGIKIENENQIQILNRFFEYINKQFKSLDEILYRLIGKRTGNNKR